MEKKYVVKDFLANQYWSVNSKWDNKFEARFFHSIEDALGFIKHQDGQFIIETIYEID